MDGADLPSYSAATAADGDRPPESAVDGGVENERAAAPTPERCEAPPPESAVDGGVEDERAAAPTPERCEALASAIAGVLAGALREHEERAAATARSQDEVAAAVDRLNGGRCLSPLPPSTLSAADAVVWCARCGLGFSSFGCGVLWR